jgi:hypothetical protein
MFTTPTLTPVGGFIDEVSKIRAGWLNYVSNNFPNALDAIGGGYYQFTADIEISSDTAQVKINAPAVADPIALLGYVTIGVSDDVNYALGVGTLTVSSAATFSAAVTFNGAQTYNILASFTRGIAVTQATADTDAIVATGNGTGQGIDATGGGSDASGGKFTGGATNGFGVQCTGTGAGVGGHLVGGANGRGALCEAGGGNNIGAQCVGAGTAAGVYGVGGATGPGGRFIGNAGDATAEAVRAEGYIYLAGTDIGAGVDAGPNRIYPGLTTKAWAKVSTDGAGNVTKVNDVGVTSVAISGSNIRVTLARAMANANYDVQLTNGDGSLFATFAVNGQTTTTVDVIGKRDDGTDTGVTYNPVVTAYTFFITVIGPH